jgi:tRNA pseudouridine55 synthase
MQGILLIDKPKDWTSFDVVGYVRKVVSAEMSVRPKHLKVGHTGTLDPLATGLLVLLIGKEYTKQAQALTKLAKVYEVEMSLGEVTDSFDAETERHHYSDYQPGKEEVIAALKTFVGESTQVPPIYSAIKIGGRRAYQMARNGQEAILEPRPVNIYDIKFIDYKYPLLKFSAHVSSGTYIRSLVNDLGNKLGSGAYMSNLRRLEVGDFKIDGSLSPVNLSAKEIEVNLSQL